VYRSGSRSDRSRLVPRNVTRINVPMT